ncbi:hypothetical protein GIB67_001871, partial [Kingdonia uniflora]
MKSCKSLIVFAFTNVGMKKNIKHSNRSIQLQQIYYYSSVYLHSPHDFICPSAGAERICTPSRCQDFKKYL